ncbi:MAG: LacI family DNA-binding transcriptional regulator, partial [Candidatus Limiplasma sp.]|nr:LacI family DNA-binding transcriptional regulator [Candidatus Limiplasma sp.]
MKCTIKDLAKAAGVSPSTVSRALHNNPRISEQARERIRALAHEMDFHPNQMARSLVNRRTRVIGIVFLANLAESLGHPFYPQVLQGLGQTAAERRHYVLLGTGQGGETTPEAIRQLVDSGYVSGLVLLAAEDGVQPPEEVPTVVIGHPSGEGFHYVDTNNLRAGQTAAEYLIRRGHRRIALLGYDPHYMVTADRRAGYEQALRFNGLPLREDFIVPSRYMDN